MYLISPKELLSRWVPTLKREQPFGKQQSMHLIITKDVLSLCVPTLKREKPFVTVFLQSCQFCRKYAIFSRYISKNTTQRVIKQSKQQFVHVISTKVVLNRWVPTLKREKPFVTVFLPSC